MIGTDCSEMRFNIFLRYGYFLLFDTIQMFFKRKIFVNIAETLFTAIFSEENIRKNG